MSKNKCLSIFSCQMEAIVFIILQIFFTTQVVLKIWKCYSNIPLFQLGHIQSCETFRPIAHERKHLMDFHTDIMVTWLIYGNVTYKTVGVSAVEINKLHVKYREDMKHKPLRVLDVVPYEFYEWCIFQ